MLTHRRGVKGDGTGWHEGCEALREAQELNYKLKNAGNPAQDVIEIERATGRKREREMGTAR